MNWTSAPSIEVAPPEPARRPIFAPFFHRFSARLEHFLEAERAQLAAWFVVAFATGIVAWFEFPGPHSWIATASCAAGLALAGWAIPRRAGRALTLAAGAFLIGLGWIALRSAMVAGPILERPQIAAFEARVISSEERAADGAVRLVLAPSDPTLPTRVRVTFPLEMADTVTVGAKVRMRARLQPPPPMLFPGTHDFARDAWFRGIGAVGRGLGAPIILEPGRRPPLEEARKAIEQRIAARLDGGAAGIAIALATGTQAAVSDEDAEAMRRSGLTHLLSVSGLHIAAVVGAAMFLALRLLALSERLALRFNLIVVSAAVGAAAGIGYTLLTGMQLPTVRSCIAALLALLGIALGRDAISMRLVAVGALVVLLLAPQSVVGISFQLSFAAVTAIVAFHSSSFADRWLARREEGGMRRVLRNFAGMIATGLAVEAALVPLTLYHFHRAGLYGVAANLFAIPWTTFVVMPLEFLALLADLIGLGGPLWTASGWATGVLLDLAHRVASLDGAVATLPSMPPAALGSMVVGGLWIALWTSKVRRWGAVPLLIGASLALATSAPDLLVSGDGRHVAIIGADGRPLLLRERTGDFTSEMVSEVSGFDGEPGQWSALPGARCSRDTCVADIVRGGRSWRLLAFRTRDRLRWETLVERCADADIVVADRRLPRGCRPRWLKLDRSALERSGGLSIWLGSRPSIETVSERVGDHPWRALAPPPPLP